MTVPLVALLHCTPSARTANMPPTPPSPAETPTVVEAKSSTEALALPSLGAKFEGKLALGVAAEPYLLDEQGPVIAHHFRRLVAENSMKWGEVCRMEGRCDFTRADTLANFARKHGMKMTGHPLIWHQMYPGWVFRDGKKDAPKELVVERMRTHIRAMVERYADVVDNWDVVNEAISDRPERLWRQLPEQSRWYEAFGSEEYVAVAFSLAAEAVDEFCPGTKLYYNDYSIENPEKRKKTLEMVRWLRGRGLRVDGVGIQGHVNLEWPKLDEFAKAIDEFAAEGLLVKISELDVSVYPGDDYDRKKYERERVYDQALEERLAARYVELFRLFLDKSQSLTSVMFWGLSDDHTWLNGWPIGRKNYPLLLDRGHRPKLALTRLLEL